MLNNIAAIYGASVVAGDYESIATTTVTAAGGQANITFSAISADYKHLQVRAFAKLLGGSGSVSGGFNIRFNSDSGSNYNNHNLAGNGTTAYAEVPTGSNPTTGIFQFCGSSSFGINIIDILDYANTNKFKTARLLSGADNNGSGNVGLGSGAWRNTAAITSITLDCGGNWQQYSSFALYGIK